MTVTPDQLEKSEDRVLQLVDAKLSALKGWGIAALLGGQALAGLLGAIVGQGKTPIPVRTAARATAAIVQAVVS